MKLIIAGSRQIDDIKWIESGIRFIQDPIAYPSPKTRPKITEVVCGEARGADKLGKQWAIQNNILVKSFPADWDKHGKKAGYLRNIEMAKYAEALLLILYIPEPDKWPLIGTKGSMHMLEIAKDFKLPYWIQYVYPNDLKVN